MLAKSCRGVAVLAAAAIITVASGPIASVQAAQTVGPVTDDIGVLRIPKGAPIQVGGSWVLSGPDTALGLDEKRAVELNFKDMGGKLMGHPLKLNAEDDTCNAEGGQTAATKLASNPQTVVVLGPACSSAATSGAPILWQQGITDRVDPQVRL
jgi:branched-chain amino acid transport system substrate-binding protein